MVQPIIDGRLKDVRACVANGANVNCPGHKAPRNHTPLQRAVCCGHADVVAYLIEAKAQIEAKDDLGRTPLYLAADFTSPDCARVLLDHGADIEAVASCGTKPLEAACNLATWAAQCFDTVQLLLVRGARLNCVWPTGCSYTWCVELLVREEYKRRLWRNAREHLRVSLAIPGVVALVGGYLGAVSP